MASHSKLNSHTNAKYLLAQFAFDGPTRGSKRLWRYEKDHAIELQEGLTSATAHKGHFAHPHFPKKEAELETRLNKEIEQPVNKFLADLKYRGFVLDSVRREKLARYVTVQFHRSVHRKSLKDSHLNLRKQALEVVKADRSKMEALAQQYTIGMILDGHQLPRPVTPADVIKGLEETIAKHSTEEQSQSEYCELVESMINFRDEALINGEWRMVYTEPEDPFVIGDAPVTTWNRVNGAPQHGVGFSTPDVEVIFPVAPTASLQILPRVHRTRLVKTPTVREVNEVQAAFATEHCFSSIKSDDLDAVLQPKFGTLRMGVNGFNIVGFDFVQQWFEHLMNAARRPQPRYTGRCNP